MSTTDTLHSHLPSQDQLDAAEEGIGQLSADFWGAISQRTNRHPLDQLSFQPDRHFVRLLAIDQSQQHFCRDATHLLAWLSDCRQRGG